MVEIKNPWPELCSARSSYILNSDRQFIEECNRSCNEKTRFIEGSIPEPFIGDFGKAKLVLLGKNPGHSADDAANHRSPAFREVMFRNLCRDSQPYPFYPLNPAFKTTGAGKWWRSRTRELFEKSGLDLERLSERLAVIEWFPYHSIAFKRPNRPCVSQKYSFQLVKQMLDANALVVRMRGKSEWEVIDPNSSLPCLMNPQCGHISSGNMEGHLFERILTALQSD